MSEVAADKVTPAPAVPEIVIEASEAEQFKIQANEYFKSEFFFCGEVEIFHKL